jgi:hypothetical protein
MLEIKAQVLFNVSGIITYIAFIAKKGNHDWHIKLREYQPSAITIITTRASVLAQSVSKGRGQKVLLQKQSNLHYDGKPLRSITEVNKFLIVLASAVLMAFIFSVV